MILPPTDPDAKPAPEPAARPKRPVSDRKREANRRNAQKAKGAVTPAGRAKVKMNAVTHAMTCKLPHILSTEDRQKFHDEVSTWQGQRVLIGDLGKL
jgi:hypothetical protein